MANSAGEFVIDLDRRELSSSLKSRLEAANLRKRHHRRRDEPRTIFRVPDALRDSDPSAYDPKLISFGPFHNANPNLKSTDKLKLRYLQKILLRNTNVDLVDYLKLIKGLEARARASYSVAIDIDSHAFVEMMLLDACFYVEILLMQTDAVSRDDAEVEYEDPVVTTNWALPMIEHDMLMLENQIPFFVIECVFELATSSGSSGGESGSLIKLLLSFFGDLLPSSDRILAISDFDDNPKFYHVLHFFHSCIVPEQRQQPRSETNQPLVYLYRRILSSFGEFRSMRLGDGPGGSLSLTPESIPCATTLKEAGVKFREKMSNSFLDVTFGNGTMEIPRLQVYDHTNSLFRNLIAFEQCFPEAGTRVATYALFMDCLVNTGEDVALLHRYGCVINGLGNDEEAALLFNQLCKEVTVEYGSCYLASLFKDVKKHCDSRWNKWRAKLMHDYFSNPWSVLSLAGALVLILLTVVQSWFAVLAYFRPPQ